MPQIDVGNGFSIDIADAQKFVNALQDRRDSLIHTLRTYGQGIFVKAPGHDDYSGGWANEANATANDYQAWNLAQQQTLTTLINNVNAVVAQYQKTEQHNTMRA